MEDEDKDLSSLYLISEVPLRGDDELVLTSSVYMLGLGLEVVCYGMVLRFNLACFNFHGPVFCFSLFGVCI